MPARTNHPREPARASKKRTPKRSTSPLQARPPLRTLTSDVDGDARAFPSTRRLPRSAERQCGPRPEKTHAPKRASGGSGHRPDERPSRALPPAPARRRTRSRTASKGAPAAVAKMPHSAERMQGSLWAAVGSDAQMALKGVWPPGQAATARSEGAAERVRLKHHVLPPYPEAHPQPADYI